MKKQKVAIIMGSTSDMPTMQQAVDMLTQFEIPHDVKIVSAHRTPEFMFSFATTAEDNGYDVIIAGAGGAAHLPGMVASLTTLPVIGVPIQSRALSGKDSLLSIVQMPGGVPVATMAIGDAGAKNAGILAAQILALSNRDLSLKLKTFRDTQKESVLANNKQ
ncbi:5-(carboxyamino)imidazole ribonucleotide mutase [Ignatzschineria sp. RMDPL8A]|uniref:5-(carboxyamino)imidazole ribonucleotide mutase n=1 Tax=Ignatzschineria sp. RMDPL8A TaxID=2999236 RepID=UPI00244668D1|nr:5-(carboxyamino)imidazole ribonucleotide mutase [Ignatzschineria sp. RMDPL8A]MDG9730278.1 5-(carboxyamino)imidazole ribonucleotide mutase [Ignatzschineria sp. RMDPL8A]